MDTFKRTGVFVHDGTAEIQHLQVVVVGVPWVDVGGWVHVDPIAHHLTTVENCELTLHGRNRSKFCIAKLIQASTGHVWVIGAMGTVRQYPVQNLGNGFTSPMSFPVDPQQRIRTPPLGGFCVGKIQDRTMAIGHRIAVVIKEMPFRIGIECGPCRIAPDALLVRGPVKNGFGRGVQFLQARGGAVNVLFGRVPRGPAGTFFHGKHAVVLGNEGEFSVGEEFGGGHVGKCHLS